MAQPFIRLGAVVVAAVLLGVLATPALAHVTANPNQASSEFFKTNLQVGHGCEGSPTTEVRVQIPDGVLDATPQVVAGWEIEVVTGPLAKPYESHGETITEGTREIAWKGGPLPDGQMQEFGMSLRLSQDLNGKAAYFPVVQTCEQGEHRWIEIPQSVAQWDELESPAPYVEVAFASEGHGGAGHAGAAGAGDAPMAAPATGTGRGTDPLTYVALAAGILGLLVGIAAFATRRRA